VSSAAPGAPAATPMIDLHTHSNRSDGTDTPAELVGKAKAVGLTVVALTDHDTTEGWAEAAGAAAEHGIELVRGLEISVEDGGQGLHLLGYEPDPDHQGLRQMLARSIEARDQRIPLMVDKIVAQVPALRLEDVLAIAGTAVVGRPPLAHALVRCGAAPDRRSAFAAYLLPGCPTYLETWSPPLDEAIGIVQAAGGAAVLAHAWGRGSFVSAKRFRELKAAGLQGIEVDHQEHDERARRELRLIATDLDLVVTGSSDYHGTRKPNRLGCDTTAPDQYQRLRDLCSAGARAG
jgi:predicted metal-dependent phosphoesterase TrpH